MKKVVTTLGWVTVLILSLEAQAPPAFFTSAQAAVRVIGQLNYSRNIPGQLPFELGSPTHVAVNGKMLIVADGGLEFLSPNNHRVLIYNDYTAGGRPSASVVMGQANFGATCGS